MEFIADLHIHSKYSRATSETMNVEELARWAKLKGIALMGTGDFTHPLWFRELKDKLTASTGGLYEYKGVNFILTCEVYNNFYVDGKAKRIHNIIFAPSLEVVERLNRRLQEHGDLVSDGRPVLKLDAKDLVKICLDISSDCFIVPS
ncbi:MAG: DNA helicase UvrD, partial [Omnitrophica WOR_2 bacterium SM23_29]